MASARPLRQDFGSAPTSRPAPRLVASEPPTEGGDRAVAFPVPEEGLAVTRSRHEEATEELLRAGAIEAAAVSVERAIVAVVERLDLERAERWLDALDGSPTRDAPSFVSAELMIALARDEPRRGVRVEERLRRAGRLAEPTPESAWSALGRALIAQRAAPRVLVRPSVYLREFGTCTIFVDGEQTRPRIAKTYELLGYLLRRPDGEAGREELLEALFDARSDDSTRAYLRQAVAGLRRLLPVDVELVDNGRVRLPQQVVIESESLDFEARLVESARLRGAERLTATLDALAVYQQGDYLPDACSDWVLDRRRALSELATDARCEAAALAFAAHRHDVAQALIRQAVSADPLRETAWRLAIRLASARGDHAGAVRAYDACRNALAEIGASPTPTTQRLVQDPRVHGGQPHLADMHPPAARIAGCRIGAC